MRTAAAWRCTLRLRTSLREISGSRAGISRSRLQKFDTDLMEQGNEDRTRHNRVQHVVTFLKNKEGRRIGPPITDVSITVTKPCAVYGSLVGGRND